ncbi:2544_t:CDS:2 [Dentiscutata erythropus]|uniref:2544_t:CDS:1 n=1 Tax=Dentiscutata erythropus TaxID=1348616 RepID=A0A9N9C017_9GLOM|nr:2544_t:CDS:2 [Dentiscutata erythropus]
MNFYVVFFAYLFALVVNVCSYIIPRETLVSDGCARIHNEFIAKQKTSFCYADVKDCYEGFPFNKDTIDTLTGLVGGFYSFLDKAKEPPQTGFDSKPMDLVAELELHAHTIFSSNCFTTFIFYTNVTFYSVVDNGEQKIKIFNDTIDRSNIDCEVTHIDGQPALQVISEYAKNLVYASRDLGVRFNIALDLTYLSASFAVRFEIPQKPYITYTLKCDNTNEFDIKRDWNAFSNRAFLNKFNDSKSYFDNICNSIEGSKPSISLSSKLREITNEFDKTDGILASDLSVTKIRTVDKFVGFFKVQDFGVVKIFTEAPLTISVAIITDVIHGFNDLANTGVKKIVLDLSDNVGGYLVVSVFFNLLLFPSTYPTFDFDLRITEQLRLAITEQYKLGIKNNIFDMKEYINEKSHANFTSVEDIFGNNVYTRGGVKGNYSNRYILSDSELNVISQFIQNLTTPLPWKPEDYIILTNGLCGSACANIAEHAAEFNNVTTVAVGGIVSNSLLSYSSFPGGFVYNSTQIFDSLSQLGLLNNTIMPKPFPLAGMEVTLPMNEIYSKTNPDEILEFGFRPADFRLFYDEKNIRNISILWSQAAALIGSIK